MDVTASGTPTAGATGFDAFSGGDTSSRAYNTTASVAGTVHQHYGLVTEFSTSTAAVPEPGTWLLLGTGLLGLGLAGVRRREWDAEGAAA